MVLGPFGGDRLCTLVFSFILSTLRLFLVQARSCAFASCLFDACFTFDVCRQNFARFNPTLVMHGYCFDSEAVDRLNFLLETFPFVFFMLSVYLFATYQGFLIHLFPFFWLQLFLSLYILDWFGPPRSVSFSPQYFHRSFISDLSLLISLIGASVTLLVRLMSRVGFDVQSSHTFSRHY